MKYMIKYLRHYVVYALFSVLVGVAIDFSYFFVDSNHKITLYNLWGNVQPSLVIGTVSTICVTIVIRYLKKKPIAGYLTNFFVVAVLFVILFFLQNFSVPYTAMIPQWIMIFAIAEAMSSIMLAIAYKLNFMFNEKLELKKASLRD